MPPPDGAPPPGDLADTAARDDEPGSINRIAVGAGIAAFLLIAMFWAAIFGGVFTRPNPDQLADASWATKAAAICKPAAAAIADLPNATTASSASARADLLDRGTEVLVPMVEQLDALPLPTSTDDQTIVKGWRADWKVYLQDRRNFATALRHDPKAKPLLTETHGGWDTDAIDTMARANDIASCATPGDM